MRSKNGLTGLLTSAVFIAAIGLSSAAQATTFIFTEGGGTIPGLAAPGYGYVTVTTVGSDLKFDVEISSPYWLVDTGNATEHAPIEFNLATSGLLISGAPGATQTALESPFQQASGGSFSNSGFNGPFNYAIACPANGADGCNDPSNAHQRSLIFYVLGGGSLSPVLTDGVYITADIMANGATGTVGAVVCLAGGPGCPSSQGGEVPLPAALPLFATGFGALGFLGWRRKRKNAAAIAA